MFLKNLYKIVSKAQTVPRLTVIRVSIGRCGGGKGGGGGEVCRNFQQWGECKFGDPCKFSH